MTLCCPELLIIEAKETTDILDALKASLKVKGKQSSTVAKAKGKIGMAATVSE
jgi:hypothetical protein